MPKRFHLKRPDLAAKVAEALSTCQDVTNQQRLLAMRLAGSGQMTAGLIAEQIGISRRQFFHWVNALKTGGVEALLARAHGGGPPPRVQGQVLEALQAGLKAGRWKRAKEIQQWLGQQHQIKLGLKGVYYWLAKIGRGLEEAAPGPRQKRRDAGGRVPAAAWRKAQELERGWWKTGAHLGDG